MTFNSGWSMTEDSKWGYVDKTGREIIPCQYDQAYNFSDGLAKVYLSIWDPDMPEPNNPFPLPSDTKRFFIDKTGQMVIEYKTEPAPAPARFNAPDDELPF